jgi:hypothetical protein
MIFAELEPILLACDDASSRVLTNGSRFIRNLPERGPLAYLHYLYGTAGAGVEERIQQGLGRILPIEVRTFLRHTNGATMFDKSIYIYGFVETPSRSTRLQDQTAVSLLLENETFKRTSPDRWASGWTKVGALTGWDTVLSLEAHASGRCAILSRDKGAVEHSSFAEMLTRIVERVGVCFECAGALDSTYGELEAALASLLRVQ